MIVALAGRRIDAEDSPSPRFPVENAEAVGERIRSCFQSLPISALVCSAARGADLLALDIAGALGIRRCVVLPSNVASFRDSSVVDGLVDGHQNGYEWGAIFDRILAMIGKTGDLLICADEAAGQKSYLAANVAIFEQVAKLAAPTGEEVRAILVWNLASRGSDDVTAAFRDEALRRHIQIEEISTL